MKGCGRTNPRATSAARAELERAGTGFDELRLPGLLAIPHGEFELISPNGPYRTYSGSSSRSLMGSSNSSRLLAVSIACGRARDPSWGVRTRPTAAPWAAECRSRDPSWGVRTRALCVATVDAGRSRDPSWGVRTALTSSPESQVAPSRSLMGSSNTSPNVAALYRQVSRSLMGSSNLMPQRAWRAWQVSRSLMGSSNPRRRGSRSRCRGPARDPSWGVRTRPAC